MKKSNNKKDQITTSATSEALILDPETRGKLQTVSNELDRTPLEVIEGLVNAIDSLFSWHRFDGTNITKQEFAFKFDFIIQHIHLLPQIAESISLLSGRDTDIVIGNLDIILETNAVTFDLGLGLYDLEKVFVTMAEGHIQLFSNRHLSGKYTVKEIEKMKGHAHHKVKESLPYVDVIIEISDSNNNVDKIPDTSNKTDRLTAGKMISIKEVELTIQSCNIKHLPTFHKFNEVMDDVIYCFEKHIKN